MSQEMSRAGRTTAEVVGAASMSGRIAAWPLPLE
jgi:hypothetical protein